MALEVEKTIDDAISALREDNSQGADNLLSALKRQLAEAAGAAPTLQPAPPRPPHQVLLELAQGIVEHLGSPAALVTLLNELKASPADVGRAGGAGV
jgi:hypothetical protein